MALNKIPTFQEVKNWVNTYADVPQATNADKLGGTPAADYALDSETTQHTPMIQDGGALAYQSIDKDYTSYSMTAVSCAKGVWTDVGVDWLPDFTRVYKGKLEVNTTTANFTYVNSASDIYVRLVDNADGTVLASWKIGENTTGTYSTYTEVSAQTSESYSIQVKPVNDGCDAEINWIRYFPNHTVMTYID